MHVRLTGQDTERGTFGHRHAVLHDARTGATYTPLSAVGPDQALFEVFNSPLSEVGCMGYEFGYSLDYPDALVLWEAQFGDFANGAQVIIDQFIVAAEQKWRRLSGLVLLLPHGYEGAGPEHSSARLERFLDMSAEDNIQVCYPTSAAQLFHLFRRQALRSWRKPLVVMTPKSLLRREEAASPLQAFTEGGWQRVIGDAAEADPASVTRLLLCSGKVAFDLMAHRAASKDTSVALARVEQLYPVPRTELVSPRETLPVADRAALGAGGAAQHGRLALHALPPRRAGGHRRTKVSVRYVGRVESPEARRRDFSRRTSWSRSCSSTRHLHGGLPMAVELTVPALGESITEAVVGKWYKKVGDAVKVDEAVVVLETDKVTIDVAAPASGALSTIAHAEGDHVKIGDVLGTIASAAEAPRAAAAAPPPALPSPRPRPGVGPEPPPSRPVPATGGSRPLSPVARKMATDAGLDPGSLRGSGASGRVTKDDVLTVLEGGKATAEAPVRAPAPPPAAIRPSGAREERVKMTPLRSASPSVSSLRSPTPPSSPPSTRWTWAR